MDGARETRKAGLALFPEILKSDVHSVRSVIEAYSKKGELEGIEEASASGLMMNKGGKWNFYLRVTSAGQTMKYKLDRWD